MHNTSAWLWRAFLRRNYITEEIAYGGQHQRGATARGLLPWTVAKAPVQAWQQQHQTAEMTVVRTARSKLGRWENKWNVKKQNAVKKHWQISALLLQHFVNCRSGTFLCLWETKTRTGTGYLSCITNQILPPILVILIWCSDAALTWLLVRYAIRDHINLKQLTSWMHCSGWCLMMTVPPNIQPFTVTVALLTRRALATAVVPYFWSLTGHYRRTK